MRNASGRVFFVWVAALWCWVWFFIYVRGVEPFHEYVQLLLIVSYSFLLISVLPTLFFMSRHVAEEEARKMSRRDILSAWCRYSLRAVLYSVPAIPVLAAFHADIPPVAKTYYYIFPILIIV